MSSRVEKLKIVIFTAKNHFFSSSFYITPPKTSGYYTKFKSWTFHYLDTDKHRSYWSPALQPFCFWIKILGKQNYPAEGGIDHISTPKFTRKLLFFLLSRLIENSLSLSLFLLSPPFPFYSLLLLSLSTLSLKQIFIFMISYLFKIHIALLYSCHLSEYKHGKPLVLSRPFVRIMSWLSKVCFVGLLLVSP